MERSTAWKRLLGAVSGLSEATAAAIVARRDAQGPFRSRTELREVPRLGPKAFEQAAGFLRLRDGAHPLDASAVHPERYPLVERMAADLGATVADLLRDGELRARIQPEKYVTAEVGLPTLKDILAELAKPGRDPRRQFEAFSFTEGVNRPEDLRPGMKLPGIVTNVTAASRSIEAASADAAKASRSARNITAALDNPRSLADLQAPLEHARHPPHQRPAGGGDGRNPTRTHNTLSSAAQPRLARCRSRRAPRRS